MARYIEKEKLISLLEGAVKKLPHIENDRDKHFRNYGFNEGIRTARLVASRIKTADVAEVVHGEWVEYEDYDFDCYYKCSVCGSERYFEGTPKENECNFCPNCGAKMDGKKVE